MVVLRRQAISGIRKSWRRIVSVQPQSRLLQAKRHTGTNTLCSRSSGRR
jgi:hypothetical protein